MIRNYPGYYKCGTKLIAAHDEKQLTIIDQTTLNGLSRSSIEFLIGYDLVRDMLLSDAVMEIKESEFLEAKNRILPTLERRINSALNIKI